MKAIALISGGLDSTLATKLMQDLGVELIALNTLSPFCLCNRRGSSGCFHGASIVARQLALKLVSIDVTQEFLEIVKKPKHGYGSNMNPCIDCRILLFQKAKELMQREGAAFVVTGEVLGQRPMSQKLNTLRLIEKESGLEGRVLRPLSAKVLQETIPEIQGWVEREKLLAISGRGRREQIALAGRFGIHDYPCPSGGCLLTDPGFSRRLKDLFKQQEFNLNDIQLLKIGRHFRFNPTAKLVVGRNEKENALLTTLAKTGDYLFWPAQELPGPTAIGRGSFTADLVQDACSIICRYCDLNGAPKGKIIFKKLPENAEYIFECLPTDDHKVARLRI